MYTRSELAGRGDGEPRRRGRIAAFAGAFASAVIAFSAVCGAAQAATAGGPSASLAFASARVSSRTRPVLNFKASGVPAGSVIYLQESAGTGTSWQFVGRIRADSGAVRLPADPAGRYEYRILVARGDVTLVTSAPASLTVTATPKPASSSNGVANEVLPWLAPVAVSVGQQIGSALVALLALIFG
jgi:hypothetical protein